MNRVDLRLKHSFNLPFYNRLLRFDYNQKFQGINISDKCENENKVLNNF